MFAFQDTRGAVEVAFTDRHGGISGGPYASLTLAEPPPGASEEHRGQVGENLRIVARALAGRPEAEEPRLVRLHQVHGDRVHVVTAENVGDEPPTADASVTTLRGVALMVRVADCVPVLLADPDRGVVGAVHAGRPGMVAGIVPRTVEALRGLGARDLVAWLGPHVCGRCYEVPADMRAEVAEAVPESFAETSWGTPSVDVGAGVTAQLRAAGVEVVDASRCTMEDEDLFSYRRQGTQSGRLAGLVWVRP